MQHKRLWPSLSRPDLFAQESPRAQKANQFLLDGIQQIQNKALADIVSAMWVPLHNADSKWLLQDNSAAQKNTPEFCEYLSTRVHYETWWGGPAAAEKSHHCYPGGWLMHNATNLHALQMLLRTAKEIRGLQIDSGAMLAAMLVHDCFKPQLLQWRNGELLPEPPGCGHHVAALAEAYLRGASHEMLIMIAGIHGGWWEHTDGVGQYLEAAAQLVDRPELASIASESPRVDFLPETWIMHQGERAWYTATKTAIQQVKPRLLEVVEKLVSPEDQQAAQWWVLMHCDELELLRNIADGTLEETVRKVLLTG